MISRVVLVGFMGSGKTVVGRRVARLLGWEFCDMDAELERRAGQSVREIFQQRGEPWFRAQETELARELAGRQRLVVAAGGGAFTVPATREALQQGALTVWLRCDLETVFRRVRLDGSRPLALDRATIGRLFAERQGVYALADRTVDAAADSPSAVARAVVAALEPAHGGGTTSAPTER